jgi:hypothetical protein
MSLSNISQLDLKINQDWSEVISIYDNVVKMWQENKLHNKIYLKNINTYQYDLGALGALTILDQISGDATTTSFIHGAIIESKLPCIKQLKSDLEELNISSICLVRADNDVLRHRDVNDDLSTPTRICKLNYIINDSKSVIYVANNGATNSRSVTKDTALLMNVAEDHWTESNGSQLYMLQICFYKPYSEVLAWFQTNTNLQYSN